MLCLIDRYVCKFVCDMCFVLVCSYHLFVAWYGFCLKSALSVVWG